MDVMTDTDKPLMILPEKKNGQWSFDMKEVMS